MSEFTDYKTADGKWRFCPRCEADLWIRSCNHFPMGEAGDVMRTKYIQTGICPDPDSILEIHRRRTEEMLRTCTPEWKQFYTSQLRSHSTSTHK